MLLTMGEARLHRKTLSSSVIDGRSWERMAVMVAMFGIGPKHVLILLVLFLAALIWYFVRR
jgi:hypothetical protein